MDLRALTPGSVIGDSYRLEREIGRGGMGSVWLAEHLRISERRVAIKFLHANYSNETHFVRFRREAEIASKLNHPNIVRVEDFNRMPDGQHYIVLEFLNGKPLESLIANGPLPIGLANEILFQTGRGLRAAHQAGIIHRDLKPQNIMITYPNPDNPDEIQVKVLDFGISKMKNSTTIETQDSTLLGTPQYMSPEQAQGKNSEIDQRTDIFALGAIMYEMVTGEMAFQADTLPEVLFAICYGEEKNLNKIAPELPLHIRKAIHKALAKKVSKRFAKVEDFVLAATGRSLNSGASIGSHTVAPPPTKLSKLSGFVRAFAVVLSIGAASTTIYKFYRSQQKADANTSLAVADAAISDAAKPDATPIAGQTPRLDGSTERGHVQADPADSKKHNANQRNEQKTAENAVPSEKPNAENPKTDNPRSNISRTNKTSAKSSKAKNPEGYENEVAKANAALRGGNGSAALQHARRATMHYGGRAPATVAVIKAKAYCLQNDIGGARSQYNNAGAQKRAVKSFCKKHGITL